MARWDPASSAPPDQAGASREAPHHAYTHSEHRFLSDRTKWFPLPLAPGSTASSSRIGLVGIVEGLHGPAADIADGPDDPHPSLRLRAWDDARRVASGVWFRGVLGPRASAALGVRAGVRVG